MCPAGREGEHLKSQHETVISKLEIALKEASETGYWLELLHRTNYLNDNDYKFLNNRKSNFFKMGGVKNGIC